MLERDVSRCSVGDTQRINNNLRLENNQSGDIPEGQKMLHYAWFTARYGNL